MPSTLSHVICGIVIARERSDRSNLNRSKALDCFVGLRPPRNDTHHLSCYRTLEQSYELRNVRPQDQDSNEDRSKCGDEHRTSGDILGSFYCGMLSWAGNVGQKLQSSVESLGDPDADHRQDDPTPLGRIQSEKEPSSEDQDGSKSVEPGIMLGLEHGG